MRAMQFPAGPSVRLCGRACHLRHCSSPSPPLPSPLPFRIRKWTFPRSGWNITRSCPVRTAPGRVSAGSYTHVSFDPTRSSWRIHTSVRCSRIHLDRSAGTEKPTSTSANRVHSVWRSNLSCYRGYKYTSHCALGRSNSVQNASLAVPRTFLGSRRDWIDVFESRKSWTIPFFLGGMVDGLWLTL